jgi:hypothetical protein
MNITLMTNSPAFTTDSSLFHGRILGSETHNYGSGSLTQDRNDNDKSANVKWKSAKNTQKIHSNYGENFLSVMPFV